MDDRRKKLLFRAWRRGFKEIDLILGAFADRRLADLDASDLDLFERILDAPDQDLYLWLTEQAPVPAAYDSPLLRSIQSFRHTLTRS